MSARAHLNTLHLFGPNAQTWLDASSMETNKFLASFHLSSPPGAAAPGAAPRFLSASAAAAPFCVRPCFPNR